MPGRAESAGAIVGLGIDLAEVDRLRVALVRTPRLTDRLFTPVEQRRIAADRTDRGTDLAASSCFAVKEAVMKALGCGFDTVGFTDIEVDLEGPGVVLSGRALARAAVLGVARWELALGVLEGTSGPVAVVGAVARSAR